MLTGLTGLTGLRMQLARVADGLVGATNELRELSRGIHPAILSEGGLPPALKTLARRSVSRWSSTWTSRRGCPTRSRSRRTA